MRRVSDSDEINFGNIVQDENSQAQVINNSKLINFPSADNSLPEDNDFSETPVKQVKHSIDIDKQFKEIHGFDTE